jgi:hypothetical protein
MAQKLGRQTEWPRVKREPVAFFQTPDAVLKSSRSLAGPLRSGTSPGVGPSGGGGVGQGSDFGTDRVSPRDFDPMGTTRDRTGTIPSDLISSQVRK